MRRWLVRTWPALAVFVAAFAVLMLKAPGLDFYLSSADHAYQLSLGRQVVLGRFPYVDIFLHYGPMVAFVSALGIWLTNTLIPETVFCAAGYAGALALLYALTARHSFENRHAVRAAGFVVALVAFSFLGRFYKWFFWLFPLAVLYCLSRFLEDSEARKRWLAAAGALAGLAGLFRLDLGLALCAAAMAALAMWSLRPFAPRRFAARAGVLALGFASPIAIWLVVLAGAGGAAACRDYAAATFSGTVGSVAVWSVPVPAFQWSWPLSEGSRLAAAQATVAATYAACVLLGAWMVIGRGGKGVTTRFVPAVGLLGFSILPTGIYRADLNHLLQVMAPALVAGGVLACGRWIRETGFGQGLTVRGAAAAYTIAAVAAGWGIHYEGSVDLVAMSTGVCERYRVLSRGVSPAVKLANNKLALQAMRMTASDEPVLVLPIEIGPEMHFFIERPISGLLNAYGEGILDTPEWRRRNLEAVRAHPPRIVIVAASFFDPSAPSAFGQSPFARFQPELYEYVRENYTEIAHRQGAYMILRRPAIQATPGVRPTGTSAPSPT